MIVTCDECSTSFQLDESRIPATGARVRCSRCKHAFFLPSPNASATDAVHSIAEEAAQDSTAGLPSAATDLPGLDGSVASEVNPSDPATSSSPESDEEDWEFTEEVRIEGDEDLEIEEDFGTQTDFTETYEDPAPSEAVNEEGPNTLEEGGTDTTVGLDLESDGPAEGAGNTGIEVDDQPSGLEIGGDIPLASDADENSVGVVAGHDDSSFGAVDDFSELAEEVDLAGVDTEPSLNADLTDDSNAGLYSSTGSTDDLGDPESWDLAPGADFDTPRVSVAGLVDSFGSSASESAEGSNASGFDAGLDPSRFDPDLIGGSKWGAGLASLVSVVGWTGTLAAIAVVGFLNLAPEWTRWSVGTQTFTQGSFSAETTHSRWVETLRSGPLLVVDGIAHNRGQGTLRPPSLQIALLDVNGERIPGEVTLAGAPLAEVTLREATPSELEESKRTAPSLFRGRPLSPGGTRAFQAVIRDLPVAARRVLLEEADASIEFQPTAVPQRNLDSVAALQGDVAGEDPDGLLDTGADSALGVDPGSASESVGPDSDTPTGVQREGEAG